MQSSDVFQARQTSKRRYLAIAQQLLNDVQRNEFGPEGRLPADRDLAARFQVSRATLREAVFALELVGILEVRHGDGTYVTRFRRDEALNRPHDLAEQPRHVIDARLTLEPPVSSLIALHREDLDVDSIVSDLEHAESMIGAIEQLPTFVNLALKFHADLVAACPNRILGKFTSELVEVDRQPLWLLINQIILQDKSAQEALLKEHREVLAAILSGASERAQASMHSHLSANKRMLFGHEPLAN